LFVLKKKLNKTCPVSEVQRASCKIRGSPRSTKF